MEVDPKLSPPIKVPDMVTFFRGITCRDNQSFRGNEEQVKRELEQGNSDTSYPELEIDFTSEEVIKGISQLKSNKAAGEDGLINELFKSYEVLMEQCLRLFNRILQSGRYPHC